MKVIVKPIEMEKWHGKKGQEAFNNPHTIEALYDSSSGGLATGLTDEEEKKYGERLGVDLSNKFDQTKPHPFYGSKMGQVKLLNSTMIFNGEKNLDFVKIKMLKASKYVANSLEDMENGLYPEATHVIFDEAESKKVRASKLQLLKKARKLAEKATQAEKVAIAQIIANKSIKGADADDLDIAMEELINEDLSLFISVASSSKEELSTRAVVLEAIQKNILVKEGSAVTYLGDILGHDLNSAVEYFKDPQNQPIKLAILEKVNK